MALLFAGSPAALSQPAEFDAPDVPEASVAPAESGPSGPSGSSAVTSAVTFAEAQFLLESAWLVPGEDGTPRLEAGPQPAGAIERLYTARFRHPGVARASGLQITVAIPAGLHYVADSAVGPGAEISYSVDGGQSFASSAELRVAVDPDESANSADPADPEAATRSATAEDYTHIRWRLQGEFLPGTAGLVSFRARPADAGANIEADVEADGAPELEGDAEAEPEAGGSRP